jgi:hypothetical protein
VKGQINIEKLTAFIMRDQDGTEGIIGSLTPIGMMPLIGADLDRIAQIEPIAQRVADTTGLSITVAEFSVRENVREITPNRTKQA